MLLTELTLKTFTGHAIKPYLSSIARLSVEVFREYPYLCDTGPEVELEHLKKYPLCEESIAVVLFEGSSVVGAATGIPLARESHELQKPFVEHHLLTKNYYHFGEALLLKAYRGRGVGHHFYEIREEHARKLQVFSHVCFYMVDREEDDTLKPADYYPLDDFWRRRNFVHHRNFKTYQKWKSVREDEATEKPCSFWIKKL